MSELVNLINVSKATNRKIKFPYWRLPITSGQSVHPSPYESYLQDTYNNFCHDLGKPHSTTIHHQPLCSDQFRNYADKVIIIFDLQIQQVATCRPPAPERTPPFRWMLNYPTLRGQLSPGGWAPTLLKPYQGERQVQRRVLPVDFVCSEQSRAQPSSLLPTTACLPCLRPDLSTSTTTSNLRKSPSSRPQESVLWEHWSQSRRSEKDLQVVRKLIPPWKTLLITYRLFMLYALCCVMLCYARMIENHIFLS